MKKKYLEACAKSMTETMAHKKGLVGYNNVITHLYADKSGLFYKPK